MDTIKSIPISLTDIQDKSFGRLPQMKFFGKNNQWANNDQTSPYSRVKLLNHVWKLNQIPTIKFFTWKLIRGRNFGIKINRDCSFCANYLEDIDHLFM